VKQEDTLKSLKDSLSKQTAIIGAMAEQQDILSAQLEGMKKAIHVMASFLPMTEADVSTAWEMAAGQVTTEMEPAEPTTYMQTIELEAIRSLLSGAGKVWRDRSRRP